MFWYHTHMAAGKESPINREQNPERKSEMRDLLTIEIPAPGAYAIWAGLGPLLAWLISSIA